MPIKRLFGIALLAALGLSAQTPGNPPETGPGSWEGRSPPPPFQHSHGPMDRALHAGRMGRWWSDPALAQKIGLSDEQRKKLDDLFQQNRLQLIDLSAALQKQEAILEPLLSADRPDETKILSQIDGIAQARAELEKSNARMLLAMRRVLTQDQWKRLQAEIPRRRGPIQR
jgi:Spy/CpxP family protein refolding chaperone